MIRKAYFHDLETEKLYAKGHQGYVIYCVIYDE
jgi:hypothetical protein